MMGRELLGLLGIVHQLGRSNRWPTAHRTGNHLAHPAARPEVDTFEFMVRRYRGYVTGYQDRSAHEQERAPKSCWWSRLPVTSCCRSGHLYLHGLHVALAPVGDRTTPGVPSLPRAVISACSPRHEMIKRLNSKIYAEARRLGVKWILGGECGHMWRGHAPIHGHGERSRRFPRSAQVSGDGHRCSRMHKLHQDGPHHAEFTGRCHSRHGKLKLDPSHERQLAGSPSTIPVTRHVPWDSSKSRATSSRVSATTSSRCPRTRFASRPSAVAGAPVWVRMRTWKCACVVGCHAETPSDYVQDKHGVNQPRLVSVPSTGRR